MTNPFKTIAISLIPNYKFQDIFLSFQLLFKPWIYFSSKPQELLKTKLSSYLNQKYIHLFDSGRTSLYFLLKALDIKEKDEIIIQAFTCSVVSASILWTGAIPVYIDIDKTYNLDSKKLKSAITSKTKAVIIQHTFGTPANIEEIQKICQQNKLILIEDCAHGLGNSYNGKKLGSFGQASFYSFGRDKVISGIWGGAISTNDPDINQKLNQLISNLPQKSFWWTQKTLLYPILMYKIINTYSLFNIGKFFHFIFRRLQILSDAITPKEKQAIKPSFFHQSLPSPICILVLNQLKKIDTIIQHRQRLAYFYSQQFNTIYNPNSSYLRYSIEINNPEGLRKYAASKNIFLGDWYSTIIAPKDINPEKFKYIKDSCPSAQKATQSIINLPTNPNLSIKDAQKIVNIVKQWQLKK